MPSEFLSGETLCWTQNQQCGSTEVGVELVPLSENYFDDIKALKNVLTNQPSDPTSRICPVEVF